MFPCLSYQYHACLHGICWVIEEPIYSSQWPMETLLAAPSGTGGGPASQRRVPTPATSTCGTSWGTTSAKTCLRCPCRWSWTSPSTLCSACVRSWSTASCWIRLPTQRTPLSAWWGWQQAPRPRHLPPSVTKPANMKLLILCCLCWIPCLWQVLVAAFAVSGYSSTYYRAGSKPFNPLLGETYECIREDKGFCFFSEQVSLLIQLFYATLHCWKAVTHFYLTLKGESPPPHICLLLWVQELHLLAR